MTGVGAPVIFVFQRIRASTRFDNNCALPMPCTCCIPSLPAVLAHSQNDTDTDDTGTWTRLVIGSPPVAHLAPNDTDCCSMLDYPAPITLAEVVVPSAGVIIARYQPLQSPAGS